MATTKRLKNPPKTNAQVKELIYYIENPKKTTDENCLCVEAFGCSTNPDEAIKQFETVRCRFDKLNGNFAYHFEQSFQPNEADADTVHQCGVEFAQALFAENGYQVIIATHVDKQHLHNHFVVNAVNSYSGEKLQTDHAFIRRMRAENDRICRVHNLSVIEHPQGKGKSYPEWLREQNGGFSWRKAIREDIDALLPECRSFKALLLKLQENGYSVKYGKYISLKPSGGKTYFRFYKLGKGYSEEELTYRILYPTFSDLRKSDKSLYPIRIQYMKLHGCFPTTYWHSGIRGMYYIYLHRLRSILGAPPALRRRMPMQCRRDAAVFQDFVKDLHLLQDNSISTLEELTKFYNQCITEGKSLKTKQAELRRQLALCDNKEEMMSLEVKAQKINDAIQAFVQNQKACERIYKRSLEIPKIKKDMDKSMKGMMTNVSRSRSNRYFSKS